MVGIESIGLDLEVDVDEVGGEVSGVGGDVAGVGGGEVANEVDGAVEI